MTTFKDPQAKDAVALTAFYRELRAPRDVRLLGVDYFSAMPETVFSDIWKDYFENPKAGRARLVCEDKKEIGFFRVGGIDKFYVPFLGRPLPDATGELHEIYLAQEYQGRGIGKVMYLQACQDLRNLNYRNMVICTYAENTEAQDFYRHMGAENWSNGVLDVEYSGRAYKRPVSFLLHRNL